jgi:hypothetical protein
LTVIADVVDSGVVVTPTMFMALVERAVASMVMACSGPARAGEAVVPIARPAAKAETAKMALPRAITRRRCRSVGKARFSIEFLALAKKMAVFIFVPS